jgi:hypothetical protein
VQFKRMGGRSIFDFLIAASRANARTWRHADGPDEMHRAQMAELELKKAKKMLMRSFGRTKQDRKDVYA